MKDYINGNLKMHNNLEYMEYLPSSFSPTKKYPLIIQLHGAGGRGFGDFEGYMNEYSIIRNLKQKEKFEFIVIAPHCIEDTWFDIFEQLKDFIQNMVCLPYVDQSRIYLSGVSMGGYTSWQVLMSMPNLFSAAIICCGGGMYWNAGRIKTPVWAFHGLKDTVVFPEESLKMVNAVNCCGGKAKITLYENDDHNCWDSTYSNEQVFEWLLTNKKGKEV